MSGITCTHDFAQKNVASAQRTKEKSGEGLGKLPRLDRRLDAQARRFQISHRPCHGDHIAIAEGFHVQQTRVPPDWRHRLCHSCEQGILITPDHHVDQDDAASPQPGFRQAEKVWCKEMRWNPAFDKGVHHNGVVAIQVPPQEPGAVGQVTFHGRGHVKIAPRDGEGARIHIQQCDAYPPRDSMVARLPPANRTANHCDCPGPRRSRRRATSCVRPCAGWREDCGRSAIGGCAPLWRRRWR